MGKWQPIETAPKKVIYRDRTPFGDLVHNYGPYILVWPVYGEVARARWWQSSGAADGRNSSNFLSDGGNAVCPTHWMPLPSPPKEKGE